MAAKGENPKYKRKKKKRASEQLVRWIVVIEWRFLCDAVAAGADSTDYYYHHDTAAAASAFGAVP